MLISITIIIFEQFLCEAREKNWRSDSSQLNIIMASRSYEQLRAVFDVYCKTNIETDIKSGMLPISEYTCTYLLFLLDYSESFFG
jgi:hypothetical protein